MPGPEGCPTRGCDCREVGHRRTFEEMVSQAPLKEEPLRSEKEGPRETETGPAAVAFYSRGDLTCLLIHEPSTCTGVWFAEGASQHAHTLMCNVQECPPEIKRDAQRGSVFLFEATSRTFFGFLVFPSGLGVHE